MGLIEKQIICSINNISKAIAISFSNGDKTSIKQHYENVKKVFSNIKFHIIDDKNYLDVNITKAYINPLIPIAKNLDKKYNTTIEKNINLMVNDKLNFNSIKNVNDLEFHAIFMKFKVLFDNCLVDEIQAYQIYKKDKEIFNLMIIELYSFFQNLEQIPQNIDKDKLLAQLLSPTLEEISFKYKLFTYQDINDFYNELNSLIIDTTLINDETLKIINHYKQKALEKNNMNKLSKDEILKLINQTKSILNNKFIMTYLKNPSISAWCSDTKVPLSLEYLINISFSLRAMHKEGNNALTSFYNHYVCCIFQNSIIDLPSKTQNDTIIHELIHAYTLTNSTISQIKIIDEKYHNLDEFITEYLSREAINYLERDILNIIKTKHVISTLGYPAYELLFKALKNTPLIDTLIEVKVNNDYQNLETKVEKETLTLLNSYLDDPSNINKFQKLLSKINIKR